MWYILDEWQIDLFSLVGHPPESPLLLSLEDLIQSPEHSNPHQQGDLAALSS